jgi:hypothetical protein
LSVGDPGQLSKSREDHSGVKEGRTNLWDSREREASENVDALIKAKILSQKYQVEVEPEDPGRGCPSEERATNHVRIVQGSPKSSKAG